MGVQGAINAHTTFADTALYIGLLNLVAMAVVIGEGVTNKVSSQSTRQI